MRLSILAQLATAAVLIRTTSARPPPPGRLKPSVDANTVPGYQPPDDEEILKYFHEPGNDEELSHYDRRYFHGVVTDEERTDTQSHMIHAYLDFFRKEKLDTWLAHGTLLGWWWNGKRFPWDVDLDTQVSNTTLTRLGKEYNQTRQHYTSTDGTVKREYLIDVNSHIGERERGDGMNVIDARWIDVRNGLYIDITGLSEARPTTHPGIWSCKNYHEYKVTDLYPMRTTMFEGVEAKVPYAYDKMLTEEYGERALVRTLYNGHEWNPQQRLWVKTEATLRREQEIRKWREENEARKAAQGAQLE